MARFYIIHEDYSVTRTDDPETAADAVASNVVIDTLEETLSDPQEDDQPIEEHQ